MGRAKTFISWLRSNVPERLKVETDGGDEHIVEVTRAKTGSPKWRDTMASIESLSPVRVYAINGKGAILGVWNFAPPPSADAPGYAPTASDSPESTMLKTFAHLLADAYKAQRDGFVQVIEAMTKQAGEDRKSFASTLTTMDRTMQRLARVRYRVGSAGDAGDEEGAAEPEQKDAMLDVMGPIIQEAMRKYVGAAPSATETPKPNGKTS
jgi:hypothetical protein